MVAIMFFAVPLRLLMPQKAIIDICMVADKILNNLFRETPVL